MYTHRVFANETFLKKYFVIMIMLMLKSSIVFIIDLIWLTWNDKRWEKLTYSKHWGLDTLVTLTLRCSRRFYCDKINTQEFLEKTIHKRKLSVLALLKIQSLFFEESVIYFFVEAMIKAMPLLINDYI